MELGYHLMPHLIIDTLIKVLAIALVVFIAFIVFSTAIKSSWQNIVLAFVFFGIPVLLITVFVIPDRYSSIREVFHDSDLGLTKAFIETNGIRVLPSNETIPFADLEYIETNENIYYNMYPTGKMFARLNQLINLRFAGKNHYLLTQPRSESLIADFGPIRIELAKRGFVEKTMDEGITRYMHGRNG